MQSLFDLYQTSESTTQRAILRTGVMLLDTMEEISEFSNYSFLKDRLMWAMQISFLLPDEIPLRETDFKSKYSQPALKTFITLRQECTPYTPEDRKESGDGTSIMLTPRRSLATMSSEPPGHTRIGQMERTQSRNRAALKSVDAAKASNKLQQIFWERRKDKEMFQNQRGMKMLKKSQFEDIHKNELGNFELRVKRGSERADYILDEIAMYTLLLNPKKYCERSKINIERLRDAARETFPHADSPISMEGVVEALLKLADPEPGEDGCFSISCPDHPHGPCVFNVDKGSKTVEQLVDGRFLRRLSAEEAATITKDAAQARQRNLDQFFRNVQQDHQVPKSQTIDALLAPLDRLDDPERNQFIETVTDFFFKGSDRAEKIKAEQTVEERQNKLKEVLKSSFFYRGVLDQQATGRLYDDGLFYEGCQFRLDSQGKLTKRSKLLLEMQMFLRRDMDFGQEGGSGFTVSKLNEVLQTLSGYIQEIEIAVEAERGADQIGTEGIIFPGSIPAFDYVYLPPSLNCLTQYSTREECFSRLPNEYNLIRQMRHDNKKVVLVNYVIDEGTVTGLKIRKMTDGPIIDASDAEIICDMISEFGQQPELEDVIRMINEGGC